MSKNLDTKDLAYRRWERARFLKKDFPFYIELSKNHSNYINKNIRFQREFWEISYIPDSSGERIVNDRIYKYFPGAIMLTHPNAKTTYCFSEPLMECYNLLFDFRLIEDELSNIQDEFGFCSIFKEDFSFKERDSIYMIKIDNEMKALIHSIYREFIRKDANYRTFIRLSLIKLLILMMRKSAERGFSMTADEIIDYVNNFLQHNFREEFSLQRLARRIGMSACYLSKLYSKKTGTTITARLKQIRLESAKSELEHSNMPIIDICYHSGFNDLSYFYRSFRARFGMCPGNVSRPGK